MSSRRPRERGLFDPPPAASPARPAAPAESAAAAESARPAGSAVPAVPAGPRTFAVSELTALIAGRLGEIGRVRVEGELSGLKRASSGHLYFDLKDGAARISCAIWRGQMGRALDFDPKEGDQVVATGKLDVYAPRGSYSLLVERIERSGLGALLAKLEELKRSLAARGWFDRKRPLPAWPRTIGVVTSRDGAALRDFLRTRSLRWPGYPLRLAHAPVQGPGAAEALAQALTRLAASGVDVIVLCRGGGSLEDLWAFNEEVLARAVFECPVPVVSGVGHETDTTLVDFVADLRAHTPTDAAGCVVPDRARLLERMARLGGYLEAALERQLERREERLARLARAPRLVSAAWIVAERRRHLEHLSARLESLGERRLERGALALGQLERRLAAASPRARIGRWGERLVGLAPRLVRALERSLENRERRLSARAATLEAISPLGVLARGYSLTSDASGRPLRDAGELRAGDLVHTRLARGGFSAKVERVEPGEAEGSPAPEAESK